MFHVYVLFSDVDKHFYAGFTKDIKTRYQQHKNGQVESTSRRQELKLIYFESFVLESDARRNEKYYKTTKGREDLRKKLRDFLEQNT